MIRTGSVWATAAAGVLFALSAGAAPGYAQANAPPIEPSLTGDRLVQVDLANRPIASVNIEGLKDVPEQLVRNQIRALAGNPYDPRVVEQDIVRITHLGRFNAVKARVDPQADGTVVLTYVVQEQAALADVRVVGNKALHDNELLGLVGLRAGDPADPFLIAQGQQRIKRAYEKKGYFNTEITYDAQLLENSRILLFRVREGPLVAIVDVQFEGNTVFTNGELDNEVQSRTRIRIPFWTMRTGALDPEQLDADKAAIRQYYHDRGYLDAVVGSEVIKAPNQIDAIVRFIISEGKQYTVRSIRFEGNALFSAAQLRQAMALKVGDVYDADKLRRSLEALIDLYGKLGFIATAVNIDRLFDPNQPLVDVVVSIEEGRSYRVGRVTIKGNEFTQDKVVLREVRGLRPGRPFDRAGIETTERRLRETNLFTDAKVSITGDPQQDERDVVIEVDEASTASVNFGAAVSSDAGVLGAISLTQRNFDITDTPESLHEFITGRAFRGAGQFFSIQLQPGNRRSLYSVAWREPYLLDTQFALAGNAYYRQLVQEDWDENRLGGTLNLGHRFGDVWSAALLLRGENVQITDLSFDAPADAFAVEGSNLVTSIGLLTARDTTDSAFFPTEGNRIEAGIHRIGLMGGDFDFTKATIEFRQYWTLDEDFMDRRTVLSLRVDAGYIFERNEAPLFERFYAGGHRSLRGFDYRGAGPRGIIGGSSAFAGGVGDDPVGGDFLFLLGLEYSYPIYDKYVRGVFFIDTGTVDKNISFSSYRVSIGAGVRLLVPFLGQIPIALDLAYPIVKEDGDDTQYFSFDVALPF